MLTLSQPITSINGFSIGDKIRLKDGDGREHTIKSFSIEGLNEFFFEVQFEDGSWTMLDNIELLHSNLDDAAHDYAWEKQELHIDFDGEEYLDYGPKYDAFKAGAEWMAERIEEEKKKHFKNALSNMGAED